MTKKTRIFLFAIFICLLVGSSLFSQIKKPRPTPILVESLKVTCGVWLIDEGGRLRYETTMHIWDKRNNKVDGIPCKFNNLRMSNRAPGHYSIEVNPATPVSGTLTLSANDPRERDHNPDFHAVFAKKGLGPLVRITGPVSGARIPLATTPKLAVSWTGGDPARKYDVYIFEIKAGRRGTKVYEQERVSVQRLVVDTRIFRSGMEYELEIFHEHGPFDISGTYLPYTNMGMDQTCRSRFFIE